MPSQHEAYGQVTTDTATGEVVCSELCTLSAHLASGTGTWTWQFKGADGTWRDIFAGTDGTTVQSFIASHMVNVVFGNDVRIRGNATSGSSPVWNWQIMSNVRNRA